MRVLAKTVNADYGIDSISVAPRERWWNHHKYPLVPIITHKPPNERNERHISFSWLFIRFWTLMTPGLSLELHVNEHGISVSGQLPYLKFHFWILPFPDFIHQWSYKKMWRTPYK